MSIGTQTQFTVDANLGANAGSAKFVDYQGNSNPGNWQVLINETVPTGKKYYLLKLFLSYRYEGLMQVYIDSDLVGSGRTGPGEKNIGFDWAPFRTATAGAVVKVQFRAHSNRPIDSVETYLQAREVTT